MRILVLLLYLHQPQGHHIQYAASLRAVLPPKHGATTSAKGIQNCVAPELKIEFEKSYCRFFSGMTR